MKVKANLHTHCTWCDGADTPRAMVEAAIAAGLSCLGFSSHAPAPFDPECSGVADEAAYAAEIRALAKEYGGQIDILCGIEQDYFAPVRRELYDYIIGSVHYMPPDGTGFNAADGSFEAMQRVKNELYGGDGLRMARDYYGLVVQNVTENKPEIVGHFDVIAKQNRGGALFDENSKGYLDIACAALDEVVKVIRPYGGIIEVNTGAMSRGARDIPYPAPALLDFLRGRDVRMMPSSDSHAAGTVAYWLGEAAELLVQHGFKHMVVFENGRLADRAIG